MGPTAMRGGGAVTGVCFVQLTLASVPVLSSDKSGVVA